MLMKKLFLLFCLLICGCYSQAQTDILTSLKKVIHAQHPDIDFENKIIAYNIWSINNAESREANKSFQKAVEVFGNAKLKGGSSGIIVVSINSENLSPEAIITFGKDANAKLISAKEEDVIGLRRSSPSNVVYDALGKEVAKNLSSSQIFPAINNLITR